MEDKTFHSLFIQTGKEEERIFISSKQDNKGNLGKEVSKGNFDS